MSNDLIYQHLRELSWRRKLTGPEQAELRAWLAAHPETQADWETEAGLNAALAGLPDVPMASNFTARVVQAAERETATQARRPEWNWPGWLRLHWVPKVALMATVVSAGMVSCLLIQDAQRKGLAESVVAVSAVPSLPSPEVLKDFDAIRASDPASVPDETLLAVLE